MENKSHVIAAVAFIVVFGIGAVVFYFWLSAGKSATRRYQIVTSQSVGGLQAQSSVNFKGLKAGHVESVDFAPHNPNKVKIVFVVADKIPITQSTYAQLSTQGITGNKALNLSNPKPSGKPLKTNADHPARIALHPALLTKLKKSGKQDMQKINHILASVHQILDAKNRKHITQTLAQIDTATRKLAAVEKAATPALQQLPGLAQQMQATLAKVNRLAEQAQKPIEQAGSAAASVQSLSQSAQRLVRRFNDETLPNLNALTHTMQETANHLDALSRELQAKPQSLLLGAPKAQPGPGEPGFNQ